MNLLKTLFGGYPGARYIGGEELTAVNEVLRAQSPYRYAGIDPVGASIELEKVLSEYTGRNHALGVSSGTAALHTALGALGIGEGDEVVIPAYGWVSILMSVLAVRAVPVIAPIDHHLGIDVFKLNECVNKKTKAVIAVHMRGFPCDINGVISIARNIGIKVIEDGAQCIGGTIDNRPVGAHGDVSVYSFQYNKLITGGEGGAVLLNDRAAARRARACHDQGMVREPGRADPEGFDVITGLGLNYRISELAAALITAQFKKLPLILGDLERVYELSVSAVSDVMEKYHLGERLPIQGTTSNKAFLCFQTSEVSQCEAAVELLRSIGAPAQPCGRVDPHHFNTWTAFLDREGYEYRCLAGEESIDVLNRSLFLELNPLAERI